MSFARHALEALVKLLFQITQILVLRAIVCRKVEMNVCTLLAEEHHSATNRVGVSHFIVHARALASQVGEEKLCALNLIEDPFRNHVFVFNVICPDSVDPKLLEATFDSICKVVKFWVIAVHPHHDEGST